MTSKYGDFLLEKKLKNFGISEYEVKEDGIHVFQDVDLNSRQLEKIPFDFAVVHGNFMCESNSIKSMKGCPKKVEGYFKILENKLTSLEYMPFEISGSINFGENELQSLEGNTISRCNGFFSCANQRTYNFTLNGGPKYVEQYYYHNNNLTTIEDYPLCIINHELGDILLHRNVQLVVQKNKDIFENLLDDKIKFHQMLMLLEPSFIKYYIKIPPPKKQIIKKNNLLL